MSDKRYLETPEKMVWTIRAVQGGLIDFSPQKWRMVKKADRLWQRHEKATKINLEPKEGLWEERRELIER